MAPLVSILVPAYNAEKWIRETIHSACVQTWQRTEVIVVDDGSRDNTLKIARGFESTTVKVVSQDNAGACAARNHALTLAQGEYIQWLDADDVLTPGKIAFQMGHLRALGTPLTLLTGPFGVFYYRHRNATFRPTSLWHDLSPVDWIVNKFTAHAWMNPVTWLVSRTLTELAGPWDDRLSTSGDDDGEYVCRIVSKSDGVQFVPKARSYYRVANFSGLSRKRSSTAFHALALSTELSIRHLLSLEDSDRTRRACITLLEHRLWHFFPEKTELLQRLRALGKELGCEELQLRETKKYFFIGKFLGYDTTRTLRRVVTNAIRGTKRNWERLLYEVIDRRSSIFFRRNDHRPRTAQKTLR